MSNSDSVIPFRLIAPDLDRPDAPQIAAALRQLQGRDVRLEVRVTPLAFELHVAAPVNEIGFVSAVLLQAHPGAHLESVASAEESVPGVTTSRALRLAQPPAFPLRTCDSFQASDPVTLLAAAARQLRPGEQLASQLRLRPERVAWQPPGPDERHLTPFGRMLSSPLALLCLMLGLPMLMYGGLALWSGQWLWSLTWWGMALPFCAGLGAVYSYHCWHSAIPADEERASVKGQDVVFTVDLTLSARAATSERAGQLLDLWQGHYHAFDEGGGNQWVAHAEHGWRRWLDQLRPNYLTAAEIAAHWHLPMNVLHAPLGDRQGHRPLLPPTALLELSQAFSIGRYTDGQRALTVHIPQDTLRHHMLVLGKTQAGKSRLVERLCEGILSDPERSLIVIDPHSSLAKRLAGKIPVGRQARTVVWDLARTDRPIPFNLLAAPGADQAPSPTADGIVEILRSLWSDSWGPRLEYHLGYLLRTLLNARLADLPTRPAHHPFTLLNVQSLVTDPDFRSAVLATLQDADLKRYWQMEFKFLLEEPRLFLEVFMPILNKVGAYVQREPARAIVGQFMFPTFVQEALTQPGCVLVDLAQSVVGADTARLIASTLLLALRNLITQRQHQPPETWTPVTVVVDELQWLNPASLDRWMAELTKFGVNLIGITQSLELLDAADPHLRAQVLSNIGSLVTFALMADDAQAMAPQLDNQVRPTDILNLPPRHCYAKLFADGGRQPVFSMETWPVDKTETTLAAMLTEQTAQRWGTPSDQVRQAWAQRQTLLRGLKKGRVKTRYDE
jgi:hypothetical protein